MISCKNCCYCRDGKDPQCPFYGQSGIHYEDVRVIEKDAHKSQFVGLFWAACLLYGHRTEKNERKAIAILEKLARKEFVPAQYLLSLCYFNGIKVPQKPQKAFELCHAAARKGCNLAEIKLYHCYRDGVGVQQDLKLAGTWCAHAAGHQSGEVFFEYAEMCCSDKYGTYNLQTACSYFKRALENGNAAAYDRLVELHKHHLKECYDGYLDPTGIFADQQYVKFGDFCLENPYAPNVKKALSSYKSARTLLLEKQKKQKADLQSKNPMTRYYATNIGFNEFGSALEKCQERIEKCYSLLFSESENPQRKTLYERAVGGDAAAQYDLALLFDEKGFELYDPEECVHWYRRAAVQGHDGAQINLGYCYGNGIGVEKDFSEAIKWTRLAAEQGNIAAQGNLGACYLEGWGVEKDCVEAVKWFRVAAEQGLASAQKNLANRYFYGDGVEKDYAEAVKWFRKAAEQGEVDAQCTLGHCYCVGLGVEINISEAVKWSRLAAEQGDSVAQSNLGAYYYNGLTGSKDYAEAVKWFRLSAEQEFAPAQFYLGLCYYNGLGVTENEEQAIKWFTLAANQGNKDAQNALEKLEKRVTDNDTEPSYSSSTYGGDPPREPELTLWHDFRTGERLARNENGDVVNSQGEIVSPTWWE